MSEILKIAKGLSEALKEQAEVRAYCKTCGEIFLDMTLKEFLPSSIWFQRDEESLFGYVPSGKKEPDIWVVRTGIHWFQNQDHEIFFEMPWNLPQFQKLNYSEVWRKKRELGRNAGMSDASWILKLNQKIEELQREGRLI